MVLGMFVGDGQGAAVIVLDPGLAYGVNPLGVDTPQPPQFWASREALDETHYIIHITLRITPSKEHYESERVFQPGGMEAEAEAEAARLAWRAPSRQIVSGRGVRKARICDQPDRHCRSG